MATSAYLQTALLNATLRSVSYVSPSALYLALYTAGPDTWGTGTEATGGSYSRQPITFTAPVGNGTTFSSGNASAINFISMPACTLTGMAVWDDPVSGNMLHYMIFGTSQVVTGGTTFTVGSGQITITSQ